MQISSSILITLVLVLAVQGRLLWCGDFRGDWESRWGTVQGWTKAERAANKIVNDPQEGTVFSVLYKKGSLGGGSGSGWRATPPPLAGGKSQLCLSYKVKFQAGFEFQNGGKLPGLAGYVPGTPGSCAGNEYLSTCFTTRWMWRRQGDATIYAYIPKKFIRCNERLIDCADDVSRADIGQGAYRFPTNQWVQITQELKLNDVGAQNGHIKVWYNSRDASKPTFNYERAVLRTDRRLQITNILFSTFFGGSSDTWRSPKDQTAYYTDFVIADSCADIFAANPNPPATCGAVTNNPVRPRAVAGETSDLNSANSAENVSENQTQQQPQGLVIGLAVGGAVLLVVLVVVIVVVLKSARGEEKV